MVEGGGAPPKAAAWLRRRGGPIPPPVKNLTSDQFFDENPSVSHLQSGLLSLGMPAPVDVIHL